MYTIEIIFPDGNTKILRSDSYINAHAVKEALEADGLTVFVWEA